MIPLSKNICKRGVVAVHFDDYDNRSISSCDQIYNLQGQHIGAQVVIEKSMVRIGDSMKGKD